MAVRAPPPATSVVEAAAGVEVDMAPMVPAGRSARRYGAAVRALLPEPGPVDPVAAHAAIARPAPDGRPWVAVNMVASLDGAIAVEGVSHALSSPADKEVFGALRGVADVILVAAGTARAERYRLPRPSPERQTERRARGQAPFPRMAVVSATLDLDPAGSLFTDLPVGFEPSERPFVYTVTDAPEPRRRQLAPVAEVVDVGTGSASLTTLLADLHGRGVAMVLAEGGPTLVGHLLAAGLVDELDLTIAPLLVGGEGLRMVHGAPAQLAAMTMAHLWEADGFLFTRYVRSANR